jgi:hypothetical protein
MQARQSKYVNEIGESYEPALDWYYWSLGPNRLLITLTAHPQEPDILDRPPDFEQARPIRVHEDFVVDITVDNATHHNEIMDTDGSSKSSSSSMDLDDHTCGREEKSYWKMTKGRRKDWRRLT